MAELNINGTSVNSDYIPEAYQHVFQPKKKEEIKLETEEPSSANGFGVYTQLLNLQALSGEQPKLVARTATTSPAKITPVNTRTVGGVTVDTSGNIEAGNYQILSGLNASQRRLARKNGFRYVGRNGELYTVNPGISRAEMRRIVNQYKRDMDEYKKLRALGLVDRAHDVYETAARNSDKQYVRYDPNGVEQRSQQRGGTSPSSYRYSFSGGLNADNGIGNLYLLLVNGMTPELLSTYANNGVLNNDSMIRYIREVGGISDFNGTDFTTDNMTTLNNALKTKYTWTPGVPVGTTTAPATQDASKKNIWSKTILGDWIDEAKSKQLDAIIQKIVENPSLIDNIPISKKGGKMNKFQYGGAVNQQQLAQEQAQAQQQQLTEIFQAIAQKPKETLMALLKQGIQPKLIIDLAQKMSDKNPAAKAALQALSQMLLMAKEGAKLQYIKRLRGECPEGYELKMFKAGGKVCTKCLKIKEEKKGGEVKGDESDIVKDFKSKRCGGKMKK